MSAKDHSVFIYVVDRDFGFAPNPFHGYCSLATCKPKIRNPAQVGDWVVGMGGSRLKAAGRCVFAMKVTEKITFNEYWKNPRYVDKKPVRNGSSRSMAGDNIYHQDPESLEWQQADSHHSKPDGSVNFSNLRTDTQSEYVLISDCFYYFGRSAPVVDQAVLESIGYTKNPRSHRRIGLDDAYPLIEWIEYNYRNELNLVGDDPFDFDQAHHRYDAESNKVGVNI